MNEYKIIIPGIVRTKKNGMTFSFKYKNRFGKWVYRDRALVILKKPYRDWCKIAVQALAVFKSKYPPDIFPLTYRVNLKVLTFIPTGIGRIDQSAIYESVQDVLRGAEKHVGVDPALYQILIDDSYQFIGGHDGSRIYIEAGNPRVEITISKLI